MSNFLLSQMVAFMALLAGMAAAQFKTRQHILQGWFVAAMLAAVHFWLLGAIEACLLVSLTAMRFLVSSFTTNPRIMYLFLALSFIAYVLTYNDPVSLLALAATLTATVASFQHDARRIRLIMMTAELFWLVHNTLIWSPVAIITEVLFFSSNTVALLRHSKE